MRRLWEILERAGEVMPPTEVYNEGNVLALVLDALDRREGEHPLAPMPGARWYREALLASPFAPRFRGDPLGEGWTHADGAVGHFSIGGGRGDLRLEPDAHQLLIIEAKLGSPLSSGTTRAAGYDQAARNVACLANAISGCPVERAGFYVLAPTASIEAGTFGSLVTLESIAKRVSERVATYEGKRDQWHADVFLPALPRIDVELLPWEEILRQISDSEIDAFYARCIEHNPIRVAR